MLVGVKYIFRTNVSLNDLSNYSAIIYNVSIIKSYTTVFT